MTDTTSVASTEWKITAARESIKSAKDKMKEINDKFGGQFSPEHPEILAMNKRITDLEAMVEGKSASESQTKADQGKSAQASAQNSGDWLARLSPYVNGMGHPQYNKGKYLIPSATQEKEEMAKRLKIFAEAAASLSDFKKSTAGMQITDELKDVANRLEKATTEFVASCKSYSEADLLEAGRKIKDLENFVKEQQAKQAAKEFYLWVNKDLFDDIQNILERAAGLLKPDDPNLKELLAKIDALKAADAKLREGKIADTKMKPDIFIGKETDLIKQKAALFLQKDRPGTQITKTSIISSDWSEESILEYTDSTQTALRYRTTRSVTVQIGGKNDTKAFLYTLDVRQDKKSDGSWGELYGHVMFTDPILEENIK
jgi:hypothetical protein